MYIKNQQARAIRRGSAVRSVSELFCSSGRKSKIEVSLRASPQAGVAIPWILQECHGELVGAGLCPAQRLPLRGSWHGVSRDLPRIIPRGMPGASSLCARLMRVGEQKRYGVQLGECSMPSSGPSGHLPPGEGIRCGGVSGGAEPRPYVHRRSCDSLIAKDSVCGRGRHRCRSGLSAPRVSPALRSCRRR